MNLQIIKSKTSRPGGSTISFGAKGMISVSSTAVEKIGIKDGASVAIAFDKDKEKDWYLLVYNNPQANSPRIRNPKKGQETSLYIFNCASYTQAFLEAFGEGAEAIKAPLSTVGEPVLNGQAIAYAIITNALNK